MTAPGYEVPISEKGYAELFRSFATEVQAAFRGSQVAFTE